MNDKIARKEAELELLKAEAEFVAKKKSGELTADDKLGLRALRRSFREEYRAPTKDGASPKAIAPKAEVN